MKSLDTARLRSLAESRHKAKNGQDDLDKANWYWAELGKLGKLGCTVKETLRRVLGDDLHYLSKCRD